MAINESTLVNAAIQSHLVDVETVNELRQQARKERVRLLDVLRRECRLPTTALYQAYASLQSITFLNADQLEPDEEICARLPSNLLQRRLVLPVRREGKLLLAMSDPEDGIALDSIKRITGPNIERAMAEPDALRSALRLFGVNVSAPGEEQAFEPVKQLEHIMQEAYIRRASDVHFEPHRLGMQVRLRVDGQLQLYPQALAKSEAELLVNRIKVMANLDISEQREAQDGGCSYQYSDWQVEDTDLRVATIPCRWGERITLRILGQASQALGLHELGMPDNLLERFRAELERPYGMILVTGPTGSGKSTTLYGALRELDKSRHNVLSVEDPIEQLVAGVSQVQVSNKVGFAGALRSFLRHDPDIILVGEIRDKDTADTALKAAMTGHLVLSTLHTNNAAATPSRLVDIGCEPYLVASSLLGVVAQRLTRRLCQSCRESYTCDELEQRQLGLREAATLYRPKGCPACLGSGYAGRIGLYEALWLDDALVGLISAGGDEAHIRSGAKQLQTLWQDAREKVLAGIMPLRDGLLLRAEDEVLA